MHTRSCWLTRLGTALFAVVIMVAPHCGSAAEVKPTVEEVPMNGDAYADENLDFLEESEEIIVPDPLIIWNQAMFQVNDRFYFYILKPVAEGYRAVVPLPVRTGVDNFFKNLTTPIRVMSSLLQGKSETAGTELARFMVNTTVGVLGFMDPAKKDHGLISANEDLGQTLGVYGMQEGIYLVWPLLGPSTLRDTLGMVGDRFLNPTSYLETWTAVGVSAYQTVNTTSLRIGDYEALREAALEPYVSLKDAYITQRRSAIRE